MGGYYDPKFARGKPPPPKGPRKDRWRGHGPLPEDPNPEDGIVRVLHDGKWLNWEEWKAARPVERGEAPPPPEPEPHTPAGNVAQKKRKRALQKKGCDPEESGLLFQ